jgi:uncharacterized protein YdeI (YjbR/CyaY-like superfamily)
MTETDFSKLKRPRQAMPKDVEAALNQAGLMQQYRKRPAYQQNDYLGWISRAKRDATRQSRLQQMLDELKCGDRYMKMPYHRKNS